MNRKAVNNIKLGAFVLAGLVFLVLLLYMIGKNRSLFGATYILKARFSHVQGLTAGNNVRYAGIESGTVKKIEILNDTLIEVTMIIDKKMEKIIRKNAIASIGTEGFVGNKVVNITAAKDPAPLAADGDILVSKKAIDTDEMLQTLSRTNSNIATVSSDLKSTVQRLNSSSALWSLFNDASIPAGIRSSVQKLHLATEKANTLADNLNIVIADVKKGKGTAGKILRDSSLVIQLNDALKKINKVGSEADSLAARINNMITGIQDDVSTGAGPLHALLKDSVLVSKLNTSLENIQKGTDGFNQNMEALKHNILFRGYFKKQEKHKKKESKPEMVSQ